MSLQLMYITNDIDIALIAQKYGVERIWIDLETIGKEVRQKGLDSVKSHHKISDIANLKPYLTTSEMLVRVNSWYAGSFDEINAVVDAGADVVMLPYWKTLEEVRAFLAVINGRCKTTLLLETREAVEHIDEVLEMGGFNEIHIGLNDLHLSYGMTFMFELLADGTVESLCQKFKAKGIPYGFGGIAKLGEGLLPAEMIVMEHYRLGSTRAILSRTFCNHTMIDNLETIDLLFRENLAALRSYERSLCSKTEYDFDINRAEVVKTVDEIVTKIKQTRGS